MNNPHIMEGMVKSRLNEFHNEAIARRLTKEVQGKKANRAKELLSGVVTFAKRLSSQSNEIKETNEMPQIRLGNEQVG